MSLEPEGSREVISAAGGHNQHRQSEIDQLCEMAMDRAVAAEEENRVGVARSRHAKLPLNIWVGLERLEVLWRGSQAEDGGGAHMRDEGSRIYQGDTEARRNCYIN